MFVFLSYVILTLVLRVKVHYIVLLFLFLYYVFDYKLLSFIFYQIQNLGECKICEGTVLQKGCNLM